MYNKLADLRHAGTTEEAFIDIYNWLLNNSYGELVHELREPGISTYDDAVQWFTDYYINDQNAGAEKAREIQYQIDHADPTKLYYGNPAGWNDYTPDELQSVPESLLEENIDNVVNTFAEDQRNAVITKQLLKTDFNDERFNAADFMFTLYERSFDYDGTRLVKNYFVDHINQVLQKHHIRFVLNDNHYTVFEIAALRDGLSNDFSDHEFIYQYELDNEKNDIVFRDHVTGQVVGYQIANGQNTVNGAFIDDDNANVIGRSNEQKHGVSEKAFQDIINEIKAGL